MVESALKRDLLLWIKLTATSNAEFEQAESIVRQQTELPRYLEQGRG